MTTKEPTNFQLNQFLRETIAHDPNVTDEAKELFILLCERSKCYVDLTDQVCELFRRNYLAMEGFPASVPTPGSARTAKQNRLRGLKMFITGRD